MTFWRGMAGFGLLEVLVSMALGLVLLVGVVNIFSGVRSATVLEENIARMQENGRFSLAYIGRELRKAGFNGLPGSELPNVEAISPLGAGTYEGDVLPDSIEFSYASDENCYGTVQSAYALKKQTFFWKANINTGIETIPALVLSCSYDGVLQINTQVLVEYVSDLQVLYGQDTDVIADGVPNRYFNADSVTDWSRIVSLQFGVLVISATENLVSGSGGSSALLGKSVEKREDGRLQKPFESTITLRNRAL